MKCWRRKLLIQLSIINQNFAHRQNVLWTICSTPANDNGQVQLEFQKVQGVAAD